MQPHNSEEDKKVEDNTKKALSSYARYSAMGFQMFVIIAVFTFIGYKIDENRNADTPIYTALLSLTGVGIALYLVIRSIKNLKP